jgi:antitoxin MazE
MKVSKWGNSLAVRLPAAMVDDLALKEGDEVDLTQTGPREFAVRRKLTRQAAIEELRTFRGMMPKGFRFDRDQANER